MYCFTLAAKIPLIDIAKLWVAGVEAAVFN